MSATIPVGPATPPLFLVDELPGGATATLGGAEGHHAAVVRRLRAGEPLWLGDGVGGLAECVVAATAAGSLTVEVRRVRRIDRPQPRFVIVQALPKGSRAELAVELLTEVGVDRIVPWAAARSVPRWRDERGAKALAGWRTTAREAAKQARRAWLPVVTEPLRTPAVAALLAAADRAVVLDPAAGAALAEVPLPGAGDVVVVVGPEGGVDAEEIAQFTAAGAVPARLGDAVLRSSTAGAAALAVLSVRTGRWR